MKDDVRELAVLGYHKIGPPPPGGWESWFYVPETVFCRQLEFLRREGWEAIALADFLQGLDDPGGLPERSVLITFDDGCRSFLEVALPCLERRFGWPSVMFVPTDFVGGRNDFDMGCEPLEMICGWDELRSLGARGVAVQSHTASHRRLSELAPEGWDEEFLRSKGSIESSLARPVEALSYPFGDAGDDPAAVASALSRAGYRAAFLYGGGVGPMPPDDPFRVPRIAMGPDTDLSAALATPGRGPGRFARPQSPSTPPGRS